jgi:hypothetical protein
VERHHSVVHLSALQPPSLLETAAALPHVRGLSPARSTTTAPPRLDPIGRRWTQPDRPHRRCGSGRGPRRFPCSLSIRSTKEEPSSVPAASPRLPRSTSPWPPEQTSTCPPPKFPTDHPTGTHRTRPTSTRLEPVSPYGTYKRWFLSYSSSSRSPDPRHLAVLARPGFVRAAPTRSGTSRTRLPSASPPCYDRDGGEGLSPPLKSSAPHGARGSGLKDAPARTWWMWAGGDAHPSPS